MSTPTVEELARWSLLGSLTSEQLHAAAEVFTVRSFPKGAILVAEGDRLDFFSVILSGRVKFFWRDEGGRQIDVSVVGPGEGFAAQSIGGEPMLTSIITLDDLRLAVVPLPQFEQLLLDHPWLALAYVKHTVALFRRTMARARSFSMEDTYSRVAEMLRAHAVPSGGALVTDRLTHAQIGQRVGATREMVGRILRELARGGYIKAEGGRFTLLRNLPRRW